MIHHVTAVNMLPLPQTDVIDGNIGEGRRCERGARCGGGVPSKYLVCIATACKQTQWTMWVAECCYCESVGLSNRPIKPPVFSLNVWFASLYTFTERGTNSGNTEIKRKLQITFESLFTLYLLHLLFIYCIFYDSVFVRCVAG